MLNSCIVLGERPCHSTPGDSTRRLARRSHRARPRCDPEELGAAAASAATLATRAHGQHPSQRARERVPAGPKRERGLSYALLTRHAMSTAGGAAASPSAKDNTPRVSGGCRGPFPARPPRVLGTACATPPPPSRAAMHAQDEDSTEAAFAHVARLTAETFFDLGEAKVMEALIQAPRTANGRRVLAARVQSCRRCGSDQARPPRAGARCSSSTRTLRRGCT